NPADDKRATRLKKDVLRGSLDLLVLAVLVDGPAHGYALQKKLAHTTGQTLPAGTLYPLLHRLEAEHLVSATWDHATKRPRKRYELTPAGQKRLQRDGADWQAFVARIHGLLLPALRQLQHHPPPPE
ncbi:MAG: PadR family transcriptional regulator, partial [Planctomycetota bacterium]